MPDFALYAAGAYAGRARPVPNISGGSAMDSPANNREWKDLRKTEELPVSRPPTGINDCPCWEKDFHPAKVRLFGVSLRKVKKHNPTADPSQLGGRCTHLGVRGPGPLFFGVRPIANSSLKSSNCSMDSIYLPSPAGGWRTCSETVAEDHAPVGIEDKRDPSRILHEGDLAGCGPLSGARSATGR